MFRSLTAEHPEDFRSFMRVLWVMLVLRLLWAAFVPLGNDEVYYWDWGRSLQLSYFDHPPGVAYLAAIGQRIFDGALGARLLVPFLHFLAVVAMARTMTILRGEGLSRRDLFHLALLTQLVPAFSLGGFFLLPDSGLLAGLAFVAYSCVLLAREPNVLRWRQVLQLGLAMGVSGLFKYHALLTAGPMFIGLIWYRRRTLSQDLLDWISVVVLGLLITAPVWIWNRQHHWVSFAYQGSHGFAGLTPHFLPALRFMGAQLLLLSPLVAFAVISVAVRTSRKSSATSHPDQYLAWGFWPLFVLLNVLSFGKELLPHWVLPAYWIMVPLVALSPLVTGKLTTWNWLYCGVLTLVLPTLVAERPVRKLVLDALHHRPGPLSDLTLWPELAQEVSGHLRALPHSEAVSDQRCPSELTLASLRWFWVAHLAFEFPQQPRVFSLDVEHPSYYNQRDNMVGYDGCRVLVVADNRHVNPAILGKLMRIEARQHIRVPNHDDVDVVLIQGVLTTASAQTEYPVLRGL